MSDLTGLPEDECLTCSEDPQHAQYPLGECKKSLRPCGHHCNCSWIQDVCHWCRTEFGGDGEETSLDERLPEPEREPVPA